MRACRSARLFTPRSPDWCRTRSPWRRFCACTIWRSRGSWRSRWPARFSEWEEADGHDPSRSCLARRHAARLGRAAQRGGARRRLRAGAGLAAEQHHPGARGPGALAQLPARAQAGRQRAARDERARDRRGGLRRRPGDHRGGGSRPARGVRARPRPARATCSPSSTSRASRRCRRTGWRTGCGARAARRWPSTCRAACRSCSRSTPTLPHASARACSSTTARAS